MRVGVPKEGAAGEQRVALVPDAVARLEGFTVSGRAWRGCRGRIPAMRLTPTRAPELVDDVVGVRGGGQGGCARGERDREARGRAAARRLPAAADRPAADRGASATRGVLGFAMESIPRTTRAQAMDALSSQATVSGYKAALIAADRLPRFLPMLTTAAGTIAPARALVLGAGVAGLQAIATARRLGAVVSGLRRPPRRARAGAVARRDVSSTSASPARRPRAGTRAS